MQLDTREHSGLMVSMVMAVHVKILYLFTWFAVNAERESILLRPRQFNVEIGKARIAVNRDSVERTYAFNSDE